MKRAVVQLCALCLLCGITGRGATASAAGFDATLDSFEVAGARFFEDEFGDGQRDAPPTSEFVDVGATVVTEIPGSLLRLTPDDGAAATEDPALFRDELLLRQPVDRALGTATVTAEFLATPPVGRRAAWGISQTFRDDYGIVYEGLYLAVRSLEGDDALLANLPSACRRTDVPVIVLSDRDDLPLACDVLDPAQFVFKLFLRMRVDTTARGIFASYSFDNRVYHASDSWTGPVGLVGHFSTSPLSFPGVFAQGEIRTQWHGLADVAGLVHAPGAGLTAAVSALHDIGAPRTGLAAPIAAATPDFAGLLAQPGSDLRTAPGSAFIATWGGILGAQATAANRARPVDPSSGRPLDAFAPPGPCATGAEPACLRAGSALGGDARLYGQACALGVGRLALDPAACALEIPASQTPVLGATLSESIGAVASGTPGVSASVLIALSGILGTPAAQIVWLGTTGRPLLVPLRVDLGDSGALTLDGLLSAEQRALLGCGPFYASECQRDGMRIFFAPQGGVMPASAEASALLQSFPGGGGPTPTGFRADAGAQPGTTDDSLVAAARTVAGEVRRLPGARLASDADYSAAIDGSTTGMFHPFTGAPFRSELAALSWNWLQWLVVFSGPLAPQLPANDEFDAMQPLRGGACSFIEPQHCRLVAAWLASAARVLDDDPSGAPAVRWWWEIGARYAVTSATGSLAPLAGGRLSALGPVLPPEGGSAAASSAWLLEPAPLADLDADGIRDGRDRCPLSPDALQRDQDGDGIGDACDDCPFTANSDQADRGGVGVGSPPDGIGDACQCGDVSGDGRVTTADALLLRRSLLTPPSATLSRPTLCNMGGSAACTVADAIIVQRALLLPPSATIGQVCSPATP